MIKRVDTDISTFEHGSRKIINIFVEGSSVNSIDKPIINAIFKENKDRTDCKMVGFCTNVLAASELLYKENPNNYFIIDRDHNDDTAVERSWTLQRKNNLIIWKRRHLENYFLDAQLLAKSKYLKKSVKPVALEKQILLLANQNLYMDISNLVILKIREEIKEKWIEKFTDSRKFDNESNSLEELLKRSEFVSFQSKVTNKLSEENIKNTFLNYKNKFTDGLSSIKIGRGRWIDLVEGKVILNQIINNNFVIKKTDGSYARGDELKLKVLEDLTLNTNITELPGDFQLLKDIILQNK